MICIVIKEKIKSTMNKSTKIKKICNLYNHYFISFLFLLLAIPNIFGIKYWSRQGLREPNLIEGIVFLIISVALYFYTKLKCRKAIVYKCLVCKEVFEEKANQKLECPYCKSTNILSIQDYYSKNENRE